MWWFSTQMASLRHRTILAKNSAWSAFPQQCEMVLHSRRKSSRPISLTARQTSAATSVSRMTSRLLWLSATSTAPPARLHNFVHGSTRLGPQRSKTSGPHSFLRYREVDFHLERLAVGVLASRPLCWTLRPPVIRHPSLK